MAYSFSKVCANTIPAGTYKAQITEIKFKESNDKSTQYNMEVHYTISEGSFAKRTVIDTIYEKAFAFRLKPFLTSVGIDMAREFSTAKELYDYGIREAKGKFIMLELGIRTYNGNEYNEVKTWNPVETSMTTAEDVLREFASNPDTLPKAPKVTDLPEAETESFEPVADVADVDFPF